MTEEIVKHQETAVAIPSAQNLRMLAQDFVNSGLFPLIKSVPEAIAKIQAGQELGIPPIASLNTMTVINSRLTLDAKLLLALAQKRAGVSWKILQETDEICEMEFSRPGFSPITVSFETKEAQVAGLLGKANWKNYKKDMLFARCSSRGVRRIAPDAVLGLYSTEEMMDAIPLGQAKVATPLAPPPSVVAPEPSQPQKQAFGEPSADFFEQAESVKDAEVVEEPSSGDSFFGDDEPKIDAGKGPGPDDGPSLFSPDVLDGLVNAIKAALKAENVDEKQFKAFLYETGARKTPPRKYVGLRFGHPSFREGDPDDLKKLHGEIRGAIKTFLKWKATAK
jgi:hypothetical protein